MTYILEKVQFMVWFMKMKCSLLSFVLHVVGTHRRAPCGPANNSTRRHVLQTRNLNTGGRVALLDGCNVWDRSLIRGQGRGYKMGEGKFYLTKKGGGAKKF